MIVETTNRISRLIAEEQVRRAVVRGKTATSQWPSESRKSQPSVKAIIRDAQNRVLLLEDAGTGLWDLPGGHVEPGESFEDALKREVKEETGLRASGVKQLESRMLKTGDKERPVVFYTANLDGKDVQVSSEHSGFKWADAEEVGNLNAGAYDGVLEDRLGESKSSVKLEDQSPATKANQESHDSTLLRTAQLQSVSNWFSQQAEKRLTRLQNMISGTVRSSSPKAESDLDTLFEKIQKLIQSAYNDIESKTVEQLGKLADIIVSGKTKATALPKGFTVLGLKLPEHFKLQSDSAFARLKASLRQGVAAKETPERLVQRVAGTAKPEVKARQIEATHSELEPWSLEVIKAVAILPSGVTVQVSFVDSAISAFSKMIDSAVQTVANLVAGGAFNDIDDGDKTTMGWEWNALHDGHEICPECEFLDGSRWDANFEPIDNAPEWPGFGQRHYGCLCSQVPVDLSGDQPQKSGLDEVFQSQDKRVLENSFGKSNVEAFLGGRINGRQLLQQHDHILSPDDFAELQSSPVIQQALRALK